MGKQVTQRTRRVFGQMSGVNPLLAPQTPPVEPEISQKASSRFFVESPSVGRGKGQHATDPEQAMRFGKQLMGLRNMFDDVQKEDAIKGPGVPRKRPHLDVDFPQIPIGAMGPNLFEGLADHISAA